MEEHNVQAGAQEGASGVESPSQTPGTGATPGTLTREEVAQLVSQSVEEASRHFQSVADRQIAELRRDFQQRQAEVEPQEDYEDDLLAQAGYFEQPMQQQPQQPMLTIDPATGQWVQVQQPQNPYAGAQAGIERRRVLKQLKANRERDNEMRELRGRIEQREYTESRLRQAGVTAQELQPEDWLNRESFDAAVTRIARGQEDAARKKADDERFEKMRQEVREEERALLRTQIARGEIGDEFLASPSVPAQGREALQKEFEEEWLALRGSGDFREAEALKEKYRELGLPVS